MLALVLHAHVGHTHVARGTLLVSEAAVRDRRVDALVSDHVANVARARVIIEAVLLAGAAILHAEVSAQPTLGAHILGANVVVVTLDVADAAMRDRCVAALLRVFVAAIHRTRVAVVALC